MRLRHATILQHLSRHADKISDLISSSFGKRHILLLLVLLTSACSDHKQIESDLQNYRERLQSYTGLKAQNIQVATQLDAPSKTSLKVDVEQIFINLREFYAFDDCFLKQMIAERNTALGKMQLPSSRFIYERELLSEMKSCLGILKQTEQYELAEKLQTWMQQKYSQMPDVYSNFVTQSDEIYLHLSASKDFIAGQSSDGFVVSKQAWQAVVRAGREAKTQQQSIEQQLQELESTRLLARMWKTQRLINQHLSALSPLLSEYIVKTDCKTQQMEEKNKIMQNIFRMFFADKIQPLASELNRYHYQLSPILKQLISQHELPNAFEHYIDANITQSFEDYQSSMKTHIGLWQDVFAQCS